MDKKTSGIIATIATVLLCGCPGLFGLCYGAFAFIISFIPGAQIDMFGSTDPNTAMFYGIGIACASVLFIAIPIVVGIVTLRKKRAETVITPDEPLPPTF